MDRQQVVQTVRRVGKKFAIASLMVGGVAAGGTGCSDQQYNRDRGWGDVPIGDVEQSSPLIMENANSFPNMSVKCITLTDKGANEQGPRELGSYLIFATTSTYSRTHVERLPDGVGCPKSGDLGFGR